MFGGHYLLKTDGLGGHSLPVRPCTSEQFQLFQSRPFQQEVENNSLFGVSDAPILGIGFIHLV
jgi:hypothetical protein